METHPLQPFLPPGARLLMLGSFPPPRRRWSMDFYYPNMQNDMWRIFGLLYHGERDWFVDTASRRFDKRRITAFLAELGVALYDTASAVNRLRDNASDKFLEVEQRTDVAALLRRLPSCRTVAATGQKAADELCAFFGAVPPRVGSFTETLFEDGRTLRLYRMPSSSRAYPLRLEAKAAVYGRMLADLGLLADFKGE